MSTPTIFALATPYAKSGVAVIRLSGPAALPCLRLLTDKTDWRANRLTLSTIRHPLSGKIIDRGMAVYFAAPKSFTGEEAAELHLHGGLAVIREALEALSAMEGLRPAEPGEFTRRAFLAGKMDLTQAEGLADLIDAETPGQKHQALRQLGGALSGYYDTLRTRMIHALAQLEAYIDFPDESIPESVLADLEGAIGDIRRTIRDALADHRRGERLREGVRVVILGAPNAGKSSLLNRISGMDAAIVSPRAGTTRDAIDVRIDIAGFPVTLTDTAGLRESADEIEEEGVRRALGRAEAADLKLVVLDAGRLPEIDPHSLSLIDHQTIVLLNKIDIISPKSWPEELLGRTVWPISAQTGQGIDQLIQAIEKQIINQYSTGSDPVITRARHRVYLIKALEFLELFSVHRPLELVCEDLRRSARAIGKITGMIQSDDVLDAVFRQFCIGK